MHPRLDAALSAGLVLAALATAGAFLAQQLGGESSSPRTSSPEAPIYHPGWRDQATTGVELADSAGSIALLVFNDLECPGCRMFHNRIVEPLRVSGGVSVRFLHLPLAGHRFAPRAAHATECAGVQGRFAAMVDQVFAMQDSLGLVGWDQLARSAEIPDTQAFLECMADASEFPRVTAGKEFASSLGINATPTLMINGWLFKRLPSEAVILATIDSIARAKSHGQR